MSMAANLMIAALTAWPLWAAALLLIPAFITSPSCGCCQTTPCGCTGENTPDEITVVLGAIYSWGSSGPCCPGLSGTFVLSKVSDTRWEYRRDAACACDDSTAEDVLAAWIDDDCYLHVRWTLVTKVYVECGSCTYHYDAYGNWVSTDNNCTDGCQCDPQYEQGPYWGGPTRTMPCLKCTDGECYVEWRDLVYTVNDCLSTPQTRNIASMAAVATCTSGSGYVCITSVCQVIAG